MKYINKDIATLTTIPERTLDNLNKKMILCICQGVLEDYLENDDKEISELDIGIGTLYIKYIGDKAKYHFEPNELLKTTLNKTLTLKESPLQDLVKDSLANKMQELYKDLC